MVEIKTDRCCLVALTIDQLQSYIIEPGDVERELKLRVSREILTDRVCRAIKMKVAKMERADPSEHVWFTYWLIVVELERSGAGLIGFKGGPDEHGEVEIGYGIDSAYRNKGYVTEGVKALVQWAFKDERCLAVIAPDTKKENKPSNRVLEKSGFRIYGESEDAFDWRLDREIKTA